MKPHQRFIMNDPTMGQEDPAQGEQPAGFAVCVTDNGDGTYSVAQMDQDSGEGEPPEQPQTAHSMDEACKMMAQMFQEESGEESQEPDDGTDGNAPLASKDQAQAVWNEMAAKKSKGPM